MITLDALSYEWSHRMQPGFGLPTLAPPPLVQLDSASTSQSQPSISIHFSWPFSVDSPSALSKNVRNALIAMFGPLLAELPTDADSVTVASNFASTVGFPRSSRPHTLLGTRIRSVPLTGGATPTSRGCRPSMPTST